MWGGEAVHDHHLPNSYKYFLLILDKVIKTEGSLDAFSRGYERYGITVHPEGIWYREWAPGVREAYFIGDFSNGGREGEAMR